MVWMSFILSGNFIHCERSIQNIHDPTSKNYEFINKDDKNLSIVYASNPC